MSWRDTTSKLWQKLCNRKEADCLKSEMKVILNRITGQSQGSIKRFTREIEFAHEVRSFFYNILLENDSDSERYQSSRTLSEAFEKSWASIASDSEDNDKMKPPSIDEVKKWISKCRLLSPVQLAQVIHELDETCPNCLIKVSNMT